MTVRRLPVRGYARMGKLAAERIVDGPERRIMLSADCWPGNEFMSRLD